MPSEPEIRATIHLYWCVSAILVVALAYLMCFVCRHELKLKPFSWCSVATPFNITLFCGAVSLICFYVLSSFATIAAYGTLPYSPDGLPVGITFALASAEVSYCFYSWYRSQAIMEILFPSWTSVVQLVVYSTPIICSLQIIAAMGNVYFGLLGTTIWYFFTVTSVALAISFTMILDTTFIASFLCAIKSMQDDMKGQIDEKCVIIAKYGAASCAVFYFAHIILAVSSTLPNHLMGELVYCISFALYGGVVILMICMKIALHHESRKRSAKGKQRVEKAKSIVAGSNSTFFVTPGNSTNMLEKSKNQLRRGTSTDQSPKILKTRSFQNPPLDTA
ncbi:hypothetical protein HDU82_001510 [Entophlyctis luteolus]|nr:hypothetical protein HDU82_001510 [Entophlyctis luteolus]